MPWLLWDHPELAFLGASGSVSEYRLTMTFDVSATPRRLIMFQVREYDLARKERMQSRFLMS